jgi:hypothetical protein
MDMEKISSALSICRETVKRIVSTIALCRETKLD